MIQCMMPMKIDKQYNGICFNDKNHKYWDANDEKKEFISVTTLIGEYSAPFDEEFWSKYKAIETLLDKDAWKDLKKTLLNTHKLTNDMLDAYGINKDDLNREQQNILDAWQKEKDEACARGTQIHSEIEHSFYKMTDDTPLKKFGIGGKFICKEGYDKLDLENGVYPEYLISWSSPDNLLNLAGQIDLLVKNEHEYTVIDHKSNKKIDQKGFFNVNTRSTTKMLYPLNTLDDCNFSHYEMQLSIYAFMIQAKDPQAVIKDLIINHYDHNMNNTLYHCIYRKEEVKRLLADYYKKKKESIRRSRREPIKY